MRRVDELTPADVHAVVAEAVEEDEIAGLELAAVDRRAVPVLRSGVVRQRDADLRVDVHDEPGAVEAARTRTAPDVRGAEVTHRDPDDAAVTRRRRADHRRRSTRDRAGAGSEHLDPCLRRGDSCARFGSEFRLARALRGPQAADLAANRREEIPPLRELALDRRLLRRALGDEAGLLYVRMLEARAPRADVCAVRLYLAQHLRALVGDPVSRVEPLDQLLDARGAHEYLETAAVATRRVELDEPQLERGLRAAEIPL